MENKLISFDLSKLLKSRGFDIKCDEGFTLKGEESHDTTIDRANANLLERPTLEELKTWLRQFHNIHINILYIPEDEMGECCYQMSAVKTSFPFGKTHEVGEHLYEDCLEIILEYALYLVY